MQTQSDQEETYDSQEQRGNNKLLATCGLTHAALASGGVLPAICLVQIAAQFHLNDARSGLIFAVGPTVTMLTLPMVGLLGERWGKRGLLIAGLCLLAVGLWLIRSSGDFSMLLMGVVGFLLIGLSLHSELKLEG
jgi:predicted MFS family arabinose efflux permease